MNNIILVWEVEYADGEGKHTSYYGKRFTNFNDAIKEYEKLRNKFDRVDIVPYLANGDKDGVLYSSYNRAIKNKTI